MNREEADRLAKDIGPDVVHYSPYVHRVLGHAQAAGLTEREALILMVQALHRHATDMTNKAIRLADLKLPTFVVPDEG